MASRSSIYDALIADHDKHRVLLGRIDKTRGDSAARRDLFERFRVEAAAHAAAEERSLYAAMLADAELRHDAQHSVAEHKEIEDLLAALGEMDFGSSGWLTRFRALKARYEHHIDEEEDEMFPHADKALSAATERKLAGEFRKAKPAEARRARES